ncbi:MAG: hypothetical protein RMI30_06460 [Thermodesulfovibrio sp.]|nr:hypothetical protein [Thermodesulfovibrio sp.]
MRDFSSSSLIFSAILNILLQASLLWPVKTPSVDCLYFIILLSFLRAVKEGAVRFELIQTVYIQELRPCKNANSFKTSMVSVELLSGNRRHNGSL